jgi:hypothetical protein
MPPKNIPSTSLHVDVLNVKGEAIQDAKVTLRPTDSKAKAITLAYDDRSATLLRALSPAQGSHFTSESLGYRGFVVSANDGPVNGYDDIRVYRGTVLSRHGARAETFSDPERILERWLMRSARGHVAEPVLQYIQSETGR